MPRSSLFIEPSAGPVSLTRRGAVLFWGTVVACIGLALCATVALYPLGESLALMQAITHPLICVVPGVFLVAPAVVGRHFGGGERRWVRLSSRARVLLFLGGLVTTAILIALMYALGTKTHWSGGDVF